jgi:parallel beta-helix repeat protein
LIWTTLLMLAACGGGGGEGAGRDSIASPPGASPTPPLAVAPAPAPDPAPVPPAPAPSSDTPAAPSNTDTVGRQRALGADASVSVEGLADSAVASRFVPAAAEGGRTFFVDSAAGDDRLDGRAAKPGATGKGPWRTLARVMQSDLAAGDLLLLACGGQWRETLRLPASGTPGRPVVVSSPAAGCGSTPPTIDGSVALAAADWRPHKGQIHKIALDTPPLAVWAGTALSEAHHPNRGHDAANPQSPYLPLAADGKIVTVAGRSVSTSVVTGAELALPEGANLASGARLRLRTNAWNLDESAVSATSGAAQGRTLTLSTPTRYPAKAGWGYFLLGQMWMLDSAGEWHHDAAARTLYAWMPDSAAPPANAWATVLATGIEVQGRSYITVNGVRVRRVGTGINLRSSTGVQLHNFTIEDTVAKGADAALSKQAVFESSAFVRTGSDAISGQDDNTAPATGMAVRNCLVRDSGVQMLGETPASLPISSRAAVRAGSGATVSGTAVINAGYIGIWPGAGSLVENNFVFGACTVLDDCGGIYTSGANNHSTLRGNTVVHSRGSVLGKPASARYTQAQGIYLDESASGVRVEGNTVIDADHGVQVHVSANNVITGNRLYGNRVSQIWLHETRARDNAAGDLFGNTVQGNQIAPATAGAVGLLLQTQFASTAAFGTFEGNRYYDRVSPTVAQVVTSAGKRGYTMAQWRGSVDAGSRSAVDSAGFAVSSTAYATHVVAGANLVFNSALAVNSQGWTHWNQTAPAGTMVREACPAGTCLRYSTGGSPGMMSSPNFSLVQGQWYRISLDLATEQDAQAVQLLVRRGGGGSNGYESLADRSLYQTAGRTWARYSAVFQATKTVNARDAATGDLGARVDIQGIEAGKSVRLANVEVVPLQPSALAHVSGALINVGGTAVSATCPLTATQAALCARFSLLSDASPVAWPLTLPAYGATLFYAQEASLTDSDRDGIADAQDTCPGTATGAAVNAAGCALLLR